MASNPRSGDCLETFSRECDDKDASGDLSTAMPPATKDNFAVSSHGNHSSRKTKEVQKGAAVAATSQKSKGLFAFLMVVSAIVIGMLASEQVHVDTNIFLVHALPSARVSRRQTSAEDPSYGLKNIEVQQVGEDRVRNHRLMSRLREANALADLTRSRSSAESDSATVHRSAVTQAAPIVKPTKRPSRRPTRRPTKKPTKKPTGFPTHKPSPRPTHRPTSPPRIDLFRSLLLSNSVSSVKDLNNQSSPQYRALFWIANKDKANLPVASPFKTIQDRYIMAAIYYATDGPNWYNQSNFLSAKNICLWHDNSSLVTKGILCNPLTINLDQNNLKGSIISEIGRLSDLQGLSASINALSGTLATELGMLTPLTSIDISLNNLRGTIVTELGRLSQLQYLSLVGNALSGTLPTHISKLAKLGILGLFSNKLSGTIITELGNMQNLFYVSLGYNGFNGKVPSELGKLPRLESLNLGGNQLLAGSLPTELGKLPLINLRLELNALSGTIPTEIGRLDKVEYLWLGGNKFRGTIPSELGRLSKLKDLELDYNNLTGTVPSGLGSLPQLSTLYLSNNALIGNLSPYFCTKENQWVNFAADCVSEVSCSCCTQCS